MKYLTMIVTIVALALAGARSALAQESAPGVTSVGHAILKVRPELLRVKIILSADGKDVHAAVASLIQKRADLKQKLSAAGAGDTVDIGEITDGNGAMTPQQQQIQMMMAARRSGQPATPQAPSVTVTCVIKAEFPIAAGSADDTFVAISDLRDKIKALASGGETKKALTPEEQEIAEETAAATGMNGSASGEPTFLFIHKLTAAERAKLQADAYADAKQDAQQLAAAAGQGLGPVIRLASGDAAESTAQSIYAAELQQMSGQGNDDMYNKQTECAGTSPTMVAAATDVNATYSLTR